ncbi:MAG: hypothetical protein JWL67_173 [Solirubrobacterales bacterium]|nr:hypothetical protein [Solirubrobacterales bacterium]
MSEKRPSTESELVEFVRAIDVRAPDSLHRSVESLVEAQSRAARRPRPGSTARSLGLPPRIAAAGAIAAAVTAVAVTLALSGRHSPPLSQRLATEITLRSPTQGAPGESRSNHAELTAAVDGISFPYWGKRLGWRPVGARIDHVAGRTVSTVFYGDGHGRRIGYAIVGGLPPPRSGGGVVRWRGGTPFRLLHEGGTPVVVWLRRGHLCVVSGRGVNSNMLLRLASWDGRGALTT